MAERQRVRDWEAALAAWASAVSGRPFVWGETDCHALARSALATMYGEDLFPDVPRWGSKQEARQRVREGEDIVATLEAHGAFRLPSPQDTTSGDLVIETRMKVFWRPTWVVVGDKLYTGEPRLKQVVAMRRPVTFPPGTIGLRVAHG